MKVWRATLGIAISVSAHLPPKWARVIKAAEIVAD